MNPNTATMWKGSLVVMTHCVVVFQLTVWVLQPEPSLVGFSLSALIVVVFSHSRQQKAQTNNLHTTCPAPIVCVCQCTGNVILIKLRQKLLGTKIHLRSWRLRLLKRGCLISRPIYCVSWLISYYCCKNVVFKIPHNFSPQHPLNRKDHWIQTISNLFHHHR